MDSFIKEPAGWVWLWVVWSKSSKKSLLLTNMSTYLSFFSKTQAGLDVGLAGWNIMIPSIMFIIHAFASLRNQIRINKLLALSQILVSVIYVLMISRRGGGKKQQWFTRGQLPSDWLRLASESSSKTSSEGRGVWACNEQSPYPERVQDTPQRHLQSSASDFPFFLLWLCCLILLGRYPSLFHWSERQHGLWNNKTQKCICTISCWETRKSGPGGSFAATDVFFSQVWLPSCFIYKWEISRQEEQSERGREGHSVVSDSLQPHGLFL